ncbi:hypothetical protein [Streptomyces sp. NPDC001678]|uniref:hypothetical protein n=1 Tax=Streptomyces sp. NPDC001678 TaxID=3364599 RepID=UPI00367D478B
MKMKKIIAGIGVALGGASLLVVTQGSAHASEASVAPTVAVEAQDSGNAPQAIGGLGKLAGKAASAVGKAGKAAGRAAERAAVHAKAAAELAGDQAAELAGNATDLLGAPSNQSLPDGASVETVFDK